LRAGIVAGLVFASFTAFSQIDTDGDGISDDAEEIAWTDPEDPSDRPMQLASGASHTLYIPTIGGGVLAWGANQAGQCGIGSFTNPLLSGVRVEDSTGLILTGAVAVAVGSQHSLILRNDGRVFSAGTNGYGQLGLGTNVAGTNRFTAVPGLTNIRAVVAGDDFSLARDTNGQAWAWGYNGFGQLGNASTNVFQALALPTGGTNRFVLLAAGAQHAAGLGTDGRLYTWGRGNYGQLGLGPVLRTNVPTAITLGSLLGTNQVIQIGAGLSQTFFLTTAGEVWAFG